MPSQNKIDLYFRSIFKAHSSGYDSTDEELGDAHGHRTQARLRARSEEFLDRTNNDDRRGVR